MSDEARMHPDELLTELLAHAQRANRKKTLLAVHEICRRQYEGSKDFSKATIGAICEKAGLFVARTLHNDRARPYVELISAWERFAGVSGKHSVQRADAGGFAATIADPVLRALVGELDAKVRRLEAQLNTARRANEARVVDARPPQNTVASEVTVITAGQQLSKSELEALSGAISKRFLEDRGWREAEHGEVIDARGRTVFAPGFVTGLRKLLTKGAKR
jgi:hypothetical protein